jgi:oligopeptide/dipeptide ABC transporter ATP-binding protein
LELIAEMREKLGTSVILITHDLGIIAEMADRVAVMYAGRIVEEAPVEELFDNQLHPYTQGLVASIPILGKVTEKLDVIPGSVPNLINLPEGCRFAPRCRLREQYGLEICTREEPELVQVRPGHKVRCWLYNSKGDHKAPIHLDSTTGSSGRA